MGAAEHIRATTEPSPGETFTVLEDANSGRQAAGKCRARWVGVGRYNEPSSRVEHAGTSGASADGFACNRPATRCSRTLG